MTLDPECEECHRGINGLLWLHNKLLYSSPSSSVGGEGRNSGIFSVVSVSVAGECTQVKSFLEISISGSVKFIILRLGSTKDRVDFEKESCSRCTFGILWT